MTDPKSLADVADRMVDGAEKLAAALQKVAPDFFSMCAHKTRVEGIVQLVLFATGALGFFAVLRVSRVTKDKEWKFAFTVVSVATGAIWLMAACASLPDTITKVSTPEWWAAQDLINAVKK